MGAARMSKRARRSPEGMSGGGAMRFHGPPVFAKMNAVDPNPKWLDLMHSLYWDSVAFLYDPAEGLFYRDAKYFPDKKKTPSGKKMFWSRGNGWVYAGIIRTLDELPQDDPQRQKYIDLFKQMTPAIVKFRAPTACGGRASTTPSGTRCRKAAARVSSATAYSPASIAASSIAIRICRSRCAPGRA